MAETTMVSERDTVLREREAYKNGMIRGSAREFQKIGLIEDAAREAFPMPKVERIRRIPDPHWPSLNWSVVNGILHSQYHSTPSEPSTSPVAPTPKRVAVWADLFANPTEFVEDDGSAAASPEGR